ncbi:sulfotransferase [Bacteroidota bacterium]
MKVKPNFFIVGAAKSGTTSLYNYLGQHPDIYFSPIKEPNYFSDDIDISKFSSIYKRNTFLDIDKYFSKSKLEELQLTFIRNPEYYERLFDAEQDFKLKGESSTSYLYSKSASQNIYSYDPKAKIIVVLRNPMERAFSHYQMAVRYGYTKLNFREAIEKDIQQKNKGWGISELFIDLGMYYEQLERYFNVFPLNQIKVLLSDDLKNNTQEGLNECFKFLGVENLKIEDQEIYNYSTSPRNIWVNYIITRIGIKKSLKNLIPNFMIKSFFKPTKDRLNRNEFDFLLDIFKEDIKRTASLINRDLNSWLEYKS